MGQFIAFGPIGDLLRRDVGVEFPRMAVDRAQGEHGAPRDPAQEDLLLAEPLPEQVRELRGVGD